MHERFAERALFFKKQPASPFIQGDTSTEENSEFSQAVDFHLSFLWASAANHLPVGFHK